MKNAIHFGVLLALTCLAPASSGGAFSAQQKRDVEKIRREEQENPYKRWLEEDAVHIITGAERDVFQTLTTVVPVFW